MRAIVRPEKLKESLDAKMSEAVLKLHEIAQADKPELNRYNEPRSYAVAFVHAAYGVVPVAETFAEGSALTAAGFKKWRGDWQAKLTPLELRLWEEMYDARRFQEHGEGDGLQPFMVEITRGDNPQMVRSSLVLGLDPSAIDSRSWKGGVRFTAYPDRPASEVCADYFLLARRFVDDFLRDHAHLLP
jgi:hypothetical protein